MRRTLRSGWPEGDVAVDRGFARRGHDVIGNVAKERGVEVGSLGESEGGTKRVLARPGIDAFAITAIPHVPANV